MSHCLCKQQHCKTWPRHQTSYPYPMHGSGSCQQRHFTCTTHTKSMMSTLVCTFTHVTHKHMQVSLCLPLEAVAKTPKQACGQVYPKSTTRVQGSIDSRNSAIHKGYHTSLRPSSLSKPRHPSLKVVMTEAVADISKCNTHFKPYTAAGPKEHNATTVCCPRNSA